MNWIKDAFSEADGHWSAKRLLYGLAVAAGVTLAAIDFGTHGGLRAESIELAKGIVYATGAAYVGGRCVEGFEK